MATMTRSVSGSTTTFVITDVVGSTLTVAITENPTAGNSTVFTSSGGLHKDGLALLNSLDLLLATDLVPSTALI